MGKQFARQPRVSMAVTGGTRRTGLRVAPERDRSGVTRTPLPKRKAQRAGQRKNRKQTKQRQRH